MYICIFARLWEGCRLVTAQKQNVSLWWSLLAGDPGLAILPIGLHAVGVLCKGMAETQQSPDQKILFYKGQFAEIETLVWGNLQK